MEKFYTCKYDRAFKEVFGKEENKDILKKLLEEILQVEIERIEYLNLERNVDNVKVKRKHLDLYLETNIGKIQVEVNTTNSKYVWNTSSTALGTTSTSWDSATSIGATEELL